MIHWLLITLLVCLKIAFFLVLGLGLFVVALGVYDWLRRRRASEHRGTSGNPARPSSLQSRRDVENLTYLRNATPEEIDAAVVFMSDHRRRKR